VGELLHTVFTLTISPWTDWTWS